MRRRSLFRTKLLIGSTVGAIAFYLVVSTRMADRERVLNELQGQASACINLTLGMTREEVVNRIGAPSKEEKARAEDGGELVIMRFPDPTGRGKSAYPLVTLEKGLLVEASCGEGDKLTLAATSDERAKMFEVLARQDQLGQDAIRP